MVVETIIVKTANLNEVINDLKISSSVKILCQIEKLICWPIKIDRRTTLTNGTITVTAVINATDAITII
ncbi:unannotated protein [freshwater metagenome]|uniref:Unannotated protein n=1 Tax=freshwater metagenome TaxID=449393 RepID=A0A6J6GPS0_9ZZZZ